jgi:hypothetical protein
MMAGLYVSSNAGASFQSLNAGLVIAQFYPGLALHPTSNNTALGGTQDNHTLLYSGPSTVWNGVTFAPFTLCDGGFTALAVLGMAPFTTTGYAECQWGTNSGYSGPRKSTDIAKNPFNLATSGINLGDAAQFVPPLVMSPSISTTLYFGTNRVYRTDNEASSWTPFSPDLTAAGTCVPRVGEVPASTTGCITTIAEAKSSNGQFVYVGTGSGRLHVTTDGGTFWILINAGLPNRAITDIAVNPTNENNVFVTVSGFGTPGSDGHVWMSTNGGGMWTDISGTMPSRLPNIPVNAIVLDPTSPTTEILVGTDLGVYRTRDGGTTWNPYNVGLPNVPVLDLVLKNGILAAATHGRGVWTAKIGAVTASHDFNGDGKSDILWRNDNGGVGVWLMRGGSILSFAGVGSLPPEPVWGIVGTYDQNGDGFSDILWRNNVGGVGLWLMNGPNIKKIVEVGSETITWSIVGVGDFNGDGIGDILWRDMNGDVAIWFLNSSGAFQSSVGVGNLPSNWRVAGTGDFNADGIRDILWRETTQGGVGIWLMNNNGTIKQIIGLNALPPAQWNIAGVGDFNGDGVSDILWRELTGGGVAIWTMKNDGTIGSITGIGSLPLALWQVAETGDFDGDGKSDILWYATGNGGVGLWLMNGTTITSVLGVGSLTTDWRIQGQNAD